MKCCDTTRRKPKRKKNSTRDANMRNYSFAGMQPVLNSTSFYAHLSPQVHNQTWLSRHANEDKATAFTLCFLLYSDY